MSVHVITLKRAVFPVNGTKVAFAAAVIFALEQPQALAAFQRASAPAAAHGAHWPVITTAFAIAMLFFTWWQQTRHRRRMETANRELTDALEALRQSESQFRQLFERSAENEQLFGSILDHISEAIYRSSSERGLIFVNQAYLRMFGYDSLEDLRSVPREQLYAHAADRPRLLAELARTGTFSRQEIVYRRKDGSTFWGLVSSIAVFHPDGTQRIDYHVGVITDISDRKKAEAEIRELNEDLEKRIRERTAELRASEERMRTLVEHAPEAIVSFDAESGRFQTVNENATRLFARSREEILALTPLELSPEFQEDGRRSRDAAQQYIAEALAGKTPVFEWVHTRADGSRALCEVRLVQLPAQDQKLVQALIFDITERKKAETELLKTLAREKELSALKSNFVSMVSHEFRTPLGIIMSSSEILRSYFEQLEPAERNEHLLSIEKNSRRMADLMEEVLLLSRVEAGKLMLEPKPTDLPALCRRLVDEVRSATHARCPIELTLDACDDETCADERLLRHILINLLTNAVKYSAEGSPVSFSMQRLGTRVRFEISDRGIGIPEQDQNWLFNAFHRGRNVGTVPGTGLGLVIVKRCVELHRGTIQIDSAPGRGTRVEVEIPVAMAVLACKPTNTTFLRASQALTARERLV